MQRREPGEVFYVDNMKLVSQRSMEVLDDHVGEEEAVRRRKKEEKGRKKDKSKLDGRKKAD